MARAERRKVGVGYGLYVALDEAGSPARSLPCSPRPRPTAAATGPHRPARPPASPAAPRPDNSILLHSDI